MTDEFEAEATRKVSSLSPDIDLDTFAAAFNIFRASTRIIQHFEATVHRPIGLSIAGFRVLFTVWVMGDMEPREIAHLSGVTRAAVSGVLNTLERDGLVERAREQTDRRLVTVKLTKEGRARLEEAYQEQNRREHDVFAPVAPAELRAFTKTLRTLLTARLDED